MSKNVSVFRVILMASAAPFIGIAAAHAQPGYAPAPAPAAPPAPAAAPVAAPTAAAPAATDPAAVAPVPAQPAPGYYPPPGYAAPSPGYAAPSPYAPPPGYYPPPGYGQPGYYPAPVYFAPQPAGPPPGYHEHDGFYMRFTMGLTVLNASWKQSETDYNINGAGMAMGMAFGGSVTPNLVLFGEFTGSVAMEPTQKIDGASSTYTNHDVSLFGIGPGVAYYLVPANLYFSGTLAFSKLSVSLHSSSDSSSSSSTDITDYGIGGTFVIGKEWWVSTNWGLGVAGQLHLASMKVKSGDSRATAEAYSILFSATYN